MPDKVEPIRPKGVDPKAPEKLARLIEVFRYWLSIPDAGAILAALSTVIANRMEGDPVWLLLVGAPGCGKTEILRSLDAIPGVHAVSTITEAGLLSATPQRFRTASASGGILCQVGESGVVSLKDFGRQVHRAAFSAR